eukprot:763312-Hanusia_phi.AAC.6
MLSPFSSPKIELPPPCLFPTPYARPLTPCLRYTPTPTTQEESPRASGSEDCACTEVEPNVRAGKGQNKGWDT